MSDISDLNDSGSKPMNETLMDLSLDESDQQNSSMEGEISNSINYKIIYCKQFIKSLFCVIDIDRTAGKSSTLLCILLSTM